MHSPLVLFALLVVSAVASAEDPPGYVFFAVSDSPGNDLVPISNCANWGTISAVNCSLRCESLPGCVAFAYNSDLTNPKCNASGPGLCLPKSTVIAPLISAPTLTLFVRENALPDIYHAFPQLDSVDEDLVPWTDPSDWGYSTATSCLARCLRNLNCSVAAFNPAVSQGKDVGYCDLKRRAHTPLISWNTNYTLYIPKTSLLQLWDTFPAQDSPGFPIDDKADKCTDFGFTTGESCAKRCMLYAGAAAFLFDPAATSAGCNNAKGQCACKRDFVKQLVAAPATATLYIAKGLYAQKSDGTSSSTGTASPVEPDHPGPSIGLFFVITLILVLVILLFPGPRKACAHCVRSITGRGEDTSLISAFQGLRKPSRRQEGYEERETLSSDLPHDAFEGRDELTAAEIQEMARVTAVLEQSEEEEQQEAQEPSETDRAVAIL